MTTPMKQLACLIPADLWDKLAKVSRDTDTSKVQIVIAALERALGK